MERMRVIPNWHGNFTMTAKNQNIDTGPASEVASVWSWMAFLDAIRNEGSDRVGLPVQWGWDELRPWN